MRLAIFAVAAILSFQAGQKPALEQPRAASSAGALIAVGGGGTTDAIVARTLEIAGGKKAVVAVLPQASSLEDAGDGSVVMWRDAGAEQVVKVDFADLGVARRAIEAATLIWIPGGDQNRFMTTIIGTGLDDLIRARHQAGAAVGGTSAGAAVLSSVMITGDADLESLTTRKTVTTKGLGLWPDVIVDQHFVQRQRQNRLMSLVLDRPHLVGVGIDEGTAVILRGNRLDVIGRSSVVIIDARAARIESAAEGQPVAGRDIKLTILRDGMTFLLPRQAASGPSAPRDPAESRSSSR